MSISSQILIKIQDVALSLKSRAGSVNILKNINATINRGETISIVGPSGSGKTSLMMLIAGLERPTKGQITLADSPFDTLSEGALTKLRGRMIGIVFQGFHLIPTMTALENVAVPLELAGDKQAFSKAQSMLESVGLGHRLHHAPSELSGGEQQRVALARAFAPTPALILADEPTGNLDTKTGQQITTLMFDMVKRHKTTLILVTHDQSLATRCSRTLRMENGHLKSFNQSQ